MSVIVIVIAVIAGFFCWFVILACICQVCCDGGAGDKNAGYSGKYHYRTRSGSINFDGGEEGAYGEEEYGGGYDGGGGDCGDGGGGGVDCGGGDGGGGDCGGGGGGD